MKRIGLSLVIVLLVAASVFADWPADHTFILDEIERIDKDVREQLK